MTIYNSITDSPSFNTRKMDLPEVPLQINTGRSFFDSNLHILRLYLPQSHQTIECNFGKSLLIGRINYNEADSLDLLDFGGQRLGVSRRHAMIIKHNVTLLIQDLRSSNGTFLNGDQLIPHQPMVLRHDDLLQLGKLQLRVIFAERPQ